MKDAERLASPAHLPQTPRRLPLEIARDDAHFLADIFLTSSMIVPQNYHRKFKKWLAFYCLAHT